MPSATFSYFFARLNFLPGVTGPERLKAIETGLGGPLIEYMDSHWSFFDVEKIEVSGQEFLSGLLVRYRPEAQERVADEKKRKVVLKDIQNAVEAEAPFFIHLDEGESLLAFRPASNKITQQQFRRMFAELFQVAHGKFFMDVEVDLVNEKLAVWQAIEELDVILRFKVILHPANPRTRDEWRIVDEDIKAKNASEYREEYIAAAEGSSGLNLKDDKLVRAKVEMAEDGYGNAVVRGVKDDKRVVASTRSAPIRAPVARTEESKEGVLAVLLETFKNLWNRFGS